MDIRIGAEDYCEVCGRAFADFKERKAQRSYRCTKCDRIVCVACMYEHEECGRRLCAWCMANEFQAHKRTTRVPPGKTLRVDFTFDVFDCGYTDASKCKMCNKKGKWYRVYDLMIYHS